MILTRAENLAVTTIRILIRMNLNSNFVNNNSVRPAAALVVRKDSDLPAVGLVGSVLRAANLALRDSEDLKDSGLPDLVRADSVPRALAVSKEVLPRVAALAGGPVAVWAL